LENVESSIRSHFGKGENIMEKFGKTVVIVLISAIAIFATGFAIMKLWGWFVVPACGFEFVSFWHAYGLALFFQALSGSHHSVVSISQKKDEKTFESQIIEAIARIIVLLLLVGIGWLIVH
jgi:hypothetical protein